MHDALGEGDAHELGLSALKGPPRGCRPEDAAVRAERKLPLAGLANEAAQARLHEDPLPDGEPFDGGAHLVHHADKLVAQGQALGGGQGSVIDMQIRPTDGGRGHPQDGVSRLLDAWLGHLCHLYSLRSSIDQCLHVLAS